MADAVPEWAPDGLDLLVNNAGGIALGGHDPAHLGGFATIDDDAWRRTLDLNLLSAVRATRALIDHLLKRGGVIVNVSSLGARIAGPGTDYGVAKAGLTNLTKALSEEYAPRGLRAVTVSPGPTRTGMWTDPARPAGDLARSLGIEHDHLLAGLPQQMGLSIGRLVEAGGDGSDHRVPRLSPGRRHHRSRHPRRRRRSQDRLTSGPSRSHRLPATSRNTATCP